METSPKVASNPFEWALRPTEPKKRKELLKEKHEDKWYSSAAHFNCLQSNQDDLSKEMELSYRQHSAFLIQSIGQWLKVRQLTINTAMVYMHRFYTLRSFTEYAWKSIAAVCLLLASKNEDDARRLDHIIKVVIKLTDQSRCNYTESYIRDQLRIAVIDESVLLQTLGFDSLYVEHPHLYIIKASQLFKLSKDITKNAYFFASHILILTKMCLQHKPAVIACFCIYFAAKKTNYELPQPKGGGVAWFNNIDLAVTDDLLAELFNEFEAIYDKAPMGLKSSLCGIK